MSKVLLSNLHLPQALIKYFGASVSHHCSRFLFHNKCLQWFLGSAPVIFHVPTGVSSLYMYTYIGLYITMYLQLHSPPFKMSKCATYSNDNFYIFYYIHVLYSKISGQTIMKAILGNGAWRRRCIAIKINFNSFFIQAISKQFVCNCPSGGLGHWRLQLSAVTGGGRSWRPS